MPQESGIEAAIRELEREDKKIREVISTLRRIRPADAVDGKGRWRRRRLSQEARRRISQSAKKRWAALKAKNKTT